MHIKRIQLGLIHVAVAMTLVPINSTLNRVMIKELGISATLVAILASLPYLLAPIQVAIGSFSDRNPVLGFHRTPYIVLGLILCVVGVAVSPIAAYLLIENPGIGVLIAGLAFGAWGVGSNLASVSYLSLATELSGEKGRSRTVAVMWFMMIAGIIATAIALSNMLDPFTQEALVRAFFIVGIAALGFGLLGVFRLEPRVTGKAMVSEDNQSWLVLARALTRNQQAMYFFIYLIILLAAILAQDILLEPYGAEAFGMSVTQTTRITSIWGGMVLAAFLVAAALENRVPKKTVAAAGAIMAVIGFVLIMLGGILFDSSVFYSGVVMLGFGTGLSTVSNLSLMLDMTTIGSVGLFIGIWGMSNALSRLVGSITGGVIRDVVTRISGNPLSGYMVVFSIEVMLLLISLMMLRNINVSKFRQQAEKELTTVEKAAIAGDI